MFRYSWTVSGIALLTLTGCSGARPPGTRLDGAIGDRRLTLSTATHHTLLELDYGSRAERSGPGQRHRVQRCKAQLKLVLSGAGQSCGEIPGKDRRPASSRLTVGLDLRSSEPTRADVTNVVLTSRGRTFWGEGTMLLNTHARARVPRAVPCEPAPNVRVPGALSGHLILSFYADQGRSGDRLGWLEGDFFSHGCGHRSASLASISQTRAPPGDK